MAAPSLIPRPPRRVQSLRLVPSTPASSCGAPGTVQPSIGSASSSNDVLPSPVEVVMSSMKTPGNCWRPQSLSAVIDTSTCLPANGARSNSSCCQPPEPPFAAFQCPLDPVLLHVPSG